MTGGYLGLRVCGSCSCTGFPTSSPLLPLSLGEGSQGMGGTPCPVQGQDSPTFRLKQQMPLLVLQPKDPVFSTFTKYPKGATSYHVLSALDCGHVRFRLRLVQ